SSRRLSACDFRSPPSVFWFVRFVLRPLMPSTTISNVLAMRYASPAMCAIWSPEGRIRIERDLWLAVLRAQRDLGLDVPAAAIADYERVKDRVDLASIERRERALLHDVKARIEEFNALAGRE